MRTATVCGLSGLALLFAWLPYTDMIRDGVFAWHVRQPRTIQGGLEVMALWLLVTGVLFVCRRRGLLFGLLATLVAFYLRRHHVDLPALTAWLYLEILIATGGAVERLSRSTCKEPTLQGYLRRFLSGLTVWLLVEVTCSMVHLGTPQDLRVALLVMGTLALALARHRPLVVHLVSLLPSLQPREKPLAGYFVVTLACLLARTNVTLDYDSLWYGLRGEYVLTAGGSFFDSLGLVSQVHYYPKLYEVLLLPLSGLDDFSFPLSLGIAAFGMILLVAYLFARELGLSRPLANLAAALAGSIPAVANSALSAKPDLFAALLLLIAAYYSWRYLAAHSESGVFLALGAVALACAAKMTSLPYGFLLLAGVAVARWWGWRAPAAGLAERDGRGLALSVATFGGGLLALSAFTLRTLLLAGVPTVAPAELLRLWQLLGFSLKYPVGAFVHDRAKELTDIPAVVYDFLFRPTRLLDVQVTWTANAWLFLSLVAAVFAFARRRPAFGLRLAWVYAPVMAAGVIFAVGFNNLQRGGDGNYYVFPLLLATLLAARAAFVRSGHDTPVLAACVALFLALHALIGFVSAAWATGTATFDFTLNRTVFDTREMRARTLEKWGLTRIAAVLYQQSEVPRVVGLGPENALRLLPARYEDLKRIEKSHPNPVRNESSFLHFLRSQHIDYLLLPRLRMEGKVENVAAWLRGPGAAAEVSDTLFRLIDARKLQSQREPTANLAFDPVPTRVYDLVELFTTAATTGQRPVTAPWKTAIAVADTSVTAYSEAPALIMAEDTALSYSLALPRQPGLVLRTDVGLLPPFQTSGISDGVEVRVEISAGFGKEYGRREYITPDTGFRPIDVPMGELAGRRVRVRLSVANVPGHNNWEDWVAWIAPEVISAR